MAIDKGQITRTFKTEYRTWRFEAESPKGEDFVISIYREYCEVCIEDGTIRTTVDPNPIRLSLQDLPGLSPFLSVSSDLATLIPDEATAAMFLGILPALIAIACDAADKKRIQDALL